MSGSYTEPHTSVINETCNFMEQICRNARTPTYVRHRTHLRCPSPSGTSRVVVVTPLPSTFCLSSRKLGTDPGSSLVCSTALKEPTRGKRNEEKQNTCRRRSRY